jgi:hypothetical protein
MLTNRYNEGVILRANPFRILSILIHYHGVRMTRRAAGPYHSPTIDRHYLKHEILDLISEPRRSRSLVGCRVHGNGNPRFPGQEKPSDQAVRENVRSLVQAYRQASGGKILCHRLERSCQHRIHSVQPNPPRVSGKHTRVRLSADAR